MPTLTLVRTLRLVLTMMPPVQEQSGDASVVQAVEAEAQLLRGQVLQLEAKLEAAVAEAAEAEARASCAAAEAEDVKVRCHVLNLCRCLRCRVRACSGLGLEPGARA